MPDVEPVTRAVLFFNMDFLLEMIRAAAGVDARRCHGGRRPGWRDRHDMRKDAAGDGGWSIGALQQDTLRQALCKMLQCIGVVNDR